MRDQDKTLLFIGTVLLIANIFVFNHLMKGL